MNQRTAMQYTPFWASVRIISGTLAFLPFLVYRREEDGKVRVPTHPAFKLLHDRANEFIDALTLKETLQAHALSYGNGFAEIQRNGAGRPVALWPLLPNRVWRRIGDDGKPFYELRLPDGTTTLLDDLNVLHIKGLGFDGYTGYNVVAMQKESIGYGIAVKEYAGRFFSGDATPGGVLEHPQNLSKTALDNLYASWKNRHQGLNSSQRLQILEEGMKYTPIGVNPEQAQSLEVQKYTVDDCARIFNIPPHKLASMDRATFCLPADVEVYTEDGPKSIADVSVGENVWSLNKKDSWQLSKVIRSGCTGIDDILHLRTTNRAFRANARHRVLVRRKHPSPAPGISGWRRIEWRNEYVPVGELKIGDTLITAGSLINQGITHKGDRHLTPEFMEFCGLLIGDGNVYSGSVSIARASNALYMDHYREVIKQNFVKYNSGHGQNGKTGTITRPIHLSESDRQTKFGSVLAAQELKELGFSGTARTKRIPDWVFWTNAEMRLSFLRGFLDADGHVDKKGRISYSSCNETMLSQMRHLCIVSGISVTNIRCQEGVTTLPNGQQKSFCQYEFTCSNPADNKRIWSHDPRYQKRLTEGRPFGRKDRAYPWHGGKGFDIEGCSLSRIVSIENEPAEKVYDLEVADTHSFIANGVVVHNSNIEEQNLDFVSQTMMYWFRTWESECDYKLFMPSEQGKLFCEILAEGLLRGKAEQRNKGYAAGRQWGWLSVNDIRRIENMNGIGPDGDIYLEPLNMKEAGVEDPDDSQGNGNTDGDSQGNDDEADRAHFTMIANQFRRVIINRDKAGRRRWAETIMRDPVDAYASLVGVDQIKARCVLVTLLDEYVCDGVTLEDKHADEFTSRITEQLGGNNGS